MVSRILLIASAACLLKLTSGLSAPFITPCTAADAECIKKNAEVAAPKFADGIPELGVQTLDPVFFEKVDSSSPNLKFILYGVTLKGLRTCKPLKAIRDPAKFNIIIQLACTMNLDGDYEMDGQVLVLKIAGKGKIHVLLRNVVTELKLDYILKEGKDGKKYLRIKKFTHSFDLKDKSDVVFEGLFQENAVLAQAANDLIKNNGNDVVKEIGGKMFEATLTKCVENFNKFFGKVPYDEIALD